MLRVLRDKCSVVMAVLGFSCGIFANLATSPFARANPRCEYLFFSDVYQDSHDIHPTVKIRDKFQNEVGESFYHLVKIAERFSWLSTHSTRRFDPQGDPRRGLFAMGYDLSHIMGYRWENSTLVAPTARTLAVRIERFNIYLRSKGISPIAVSFYDQPKTSLELFLREWARARALPVANGGTGHTIHDISYHYSGVLLPDVLTSLFQIEARIALSWNEVEPHLTRVAHFNFTASMIDNLSVTANRTSDQEMADANADRILKRYSPLLKGETHSPAFFAEHTPLDIFFRRLRNNGSVVPRENEQLFREYMALQSPETVKPLYEHGLRDVESLRDAFNDRAHELRQAANDYLAENGDD